MSPSTRVPLWVAVRTRSERSASGATPVRAGPETGAPDSTWTAHLAAALSRRTSLRVRAIDEDDPAPDRSGFPNAVRIWNSRDRWGACQLLVVSEPTEEGEPAPPDGTALYRDLAPASVEVSAASAHLDAEPTESEVDARAETIGLALGLRAPGAGGSGALRLGEGTDAIVLAGGGSRRMGTDKARLPVAGERGTWLERSVLLVAPWVREVTVVGRSVSAPDCPSLRELPRSSADLHPGRGPLGGIETGFALAPGRNLLVLSCDLPDLPPRLVRDLLVGAEGGGDPDAVAYRGATGEIAAPLLWLHPRTAEALAEQLRAGDLRLRALLARLRTRWLDVSPEDAPLLRGCNTPAERRSRPEDGGGPGHGRAQPRSELQ